MRASASASVSRCSASPMVSLVSARPSLARCRPVNWMRRRTTSSTSQPKLRRTWPDLTIVRAFGAKPRAKSRPDRTDADEMDSRSPFAPCSSASQRWHSSESAPFYENCGGHLGHSSAMFRDSLTQVARRRHRDCRKLHGGCVECWTSRGSTGHCLDPRAPLQGVGWTRGLAAAAWS